MTMEIKGDPFLIRDATILRDVLEGARYFYHDYRLCFYKGFTEGDSSAFASCGLSGFGFREWSTDSSGASVASGSEARFRRELLYQGYNVTIRVPCGLPEGQ